MTDNERKELLLKAKPILFNTEMVRAILDGRKTVTRRVIKPQPVCRVENITIPMRDGDFLLYAAPYTTGDILYVRETWAKMDCNECSEDSYDCESAVERDGLIVFCDGEMYVYKATDLLPDGIKWHPSIHMPKEAARIFLRVTNVRVERLQDITEEQVEREGIYRNKNFNNWYTVGDGNHNSVPKLCFRRLWDSTIKKSDLDKYGWAANPWIWIIKFERID